MVRVHGGRPRDGTTAFTHTISHGSRIYRWLRRALMIGVPLKDDMDPAIDAWNALPKVGMKGSVGA